MLAVARAIAADKVLTIELDFIPFSWRVLLINVSYSGVPDTLHRKLRNFVHKKSLPRDWAGFFT
jgi:hypothetical protein